MSSREPVEWAADLFAQRSALEGAAAVEVLDLGDLQSRAVREIIEGAPISLLVDGADLQSSGTSLVKALARHNVVPEFVGVVRDDGRPTAIAVCRGSSPPRIEPAPGDFTVTAIIPAFNEEDVIQATVGHLIANGVKVYLIDNWSTDRTVDRAMRFVDRGLVGVERFPPEGPSTTFDLSALQERVEEVARTLESDWILSNDADEFRYAPWEGVPLRDALFHVQQSGYNAVNYTALNFALTSDNFTDGADPNDHLSWFAFEPGSSIRLNTWRKPAGARAEVAWSGGHTVRFPGVATFPYNFLLKHFPIRSVAQGRRKVFKERLPRFPVDERLRGWHSHYDHMKEGDLVKSSNGLIRYDPDFNSSYLLERLAGPRPEPGVQSSNRRSDTIRLLRRTGLLEPVLKWRWRLSGRAAR